MSTGTITLITTPPDRYEQLLENYSSILEKTNNQLGWGINIASLYVTILSALIGFMSIVVAWYLWKNSREQKSRADNFFNKIDKRFKEIEEIEEKRIAKANEEYEQLINEQRNKLNDATTEGKKKIEETILELKAMKIAAGAQINNPVTSGTNTFVSGTRTFASFYRESIFCTNCGKKFQTNISPSVTSGIVHRKVFCAHCGSENLSAF